MEKKKLIGTIIGVVAFILLIAGATFAWLTIAATVTNGNYNTRTLNFTYTYDADASNAISNVFMLGSEPERNSITAKNGYVVLTASKGTGTAMASSFKLILSKTINGIEDDNVFRYAVCHSDTATDCNNAASTTIPSTVSGNWVAVGTIDSGTEDQELYDDTTTFRVEGAKAATYYVYFWLDGSAITSDNQSDILNKTFSGYIYATSTQTDTASN